MNDQEPIKEETCAVLKKAMRVVNSRVVVVLEDKATGEKRRFESKNIVTDAGDLYYAQRGVNATPTNFTTGATFDGIMELYTNAGTPNAAPGKANTRANLTGTIAPSSAKVIDATYPLVNDADGDNTGAGVDVVTYRTSYLTTEANAVDITDVIITNPSPGASEPILMHAEFGAAFTKTSSDTLKVFINHTMSGV